MAEQTPPNDKAALEALAKLSTSQHQALRDQLAKANPALRSEDVSRQLTVPGLADAQVLSLVEFLITLHSVRVRRDTAIEDFAESIASVAKTEEISPSDGWDAFKTRLQELLRQERILGVTAKASEVLHEHDNSLCTAQLFTELRPVFGSDVSQPPVAAAIHHLLRVSYHNGDSLEELFLTMDINSIRKLQSLLTCAVDKESSLRKFIDSSGIKFLDRTRHK